MTKCIICNNNTFAIKYEILTECLNCRHIFADINLDFEKINEIYSDKYFFGDEYINYISDRKQIEKNALNRLKVIKKYIEKLNKKNLLC